MWQLQLTPPNAIEAAMTNPPLIEARSVTAGYHETEVVRDLDLSVSAGQVVALLGPNGAGKTTTLMTLCGQLPPLAGEVLMDGEAVRSPLHVRARRGLGLVTEQRSVFMKMTVADNLRVSRCDAQLAMQMFPELAPHVGRKVGLLSGGQQQMLALARALTRGQPRVLLIDEISLGLGPLIMDRLLVAVRRSADSGVGVLLVEQYVHKALGVADQIYVLSRGRVVTTGPAADFRGKEDALQRAYLSA
jgi:branched-chain amino acid transport system ATP-binding protein